MYRGTVPGIQTEYVDINTTNLNITAITPNAFISTGAGNDVLSASSGRNVLDAGTGNNLFFGSIGQDSFVATANGTVSNAVLNFGRGDDITIRGLDPASVSLTTADFFDGLGPSLQLKATTTATGATAASLFIGGFTTNDVSVGRLTISFDTNGLRVVAN